MTALQLTAMSQDDTHHYRLAIEPQYRKGNRNPHGYKPVIYAQSTKAGAPDERRYWAGSVHRLSSEAKAEGRAEQERLQAGLNRTKYVPIRARERAAQGKNLGPLARTEAERDVLELVKLNGMPGGPRRGVIHTEESRRKISEALRKRHKEGRFDYTKLGRLTNVERRKRDEPIAKAQGLTVDQYWARLELERVKKKVEQAELKAKRDAFKDDAHQKAYRDLVARGVL